MEIGSFWVTQRVLFLVYISVMQSDGVTHESYLSREITGGRSTATRDSMSEKESTFRLLSSTQARDFVVNPSIRSVPFFLTLPPPLHLFFNEIGILCYALVRGTSIW